MASTSDEFDDQDDLLQLAQHPFPLLDGSQSDRPVRKRSSKACDNCRKAKCKCERIPSAAANGEPCRNCIVLGAECTFLGPSRKRGPPKGYIDALESKLHQMEALLGTIITSEDPVARSLIGHLSQDALAREIIHRVDQSPFGSRGRKQAAASRELYGSSSLPQSSKRRDSLKGADGEPRHGFVGPPHEWQDALTNLIDSRAGSATRSTPCTGFVESSSSLPDDSKLVYPKYAYNAVNPHQRRRIETTSPPLNLIDARGLGNAIPSARPHGPASPSRVVKPHSAYSATPPDLTRPPLEDENSDSDADLADALGQLSVNEIQQVRYHGKASGLHLLAPAMQAANGSHDPRSSQYTRFKSGFWEFPPAGVWPPVAPGGGGPPSEFKSIADVDAVTARDFPNRAQQDHLIGLYFTYVHPVLPLVIKPQFMRDFVIRNDATHPEQQAALSRVPNVLLFAMFANAARYSSDTPLPEEGNLWTAGYAYWDRANEMLFRTSMLWSGISGSAYIQSLLLLGYREIGVGAMARAWMIVGIATRNAQDLGFHRSMDKWDVSGREAFTQDEKEVRSRVWYSCIRMDRYVSTYIGRPLGVYERDYDTRLPEEREEEENELWVEHPLATSDKPPTAPGPQASRVLSCFKASIALSNMIGTIVSSLYAIRLPSSSVRYRERAAIEHRLEKWLLDLPDHLRLNDPNRPVLPHVLTLHMQYWCTVVLLNRPFMTVPKRNPSSPGSSSSVEPEEVVATDAKVFNACQTAAHHITHLATSFAEAFCMRRAPALFSYYLFTAAIMHVTSLIENPVDVQASLGFQKTVDILRRMQVVWPSAGRACDVLDGVKIDLRCADLALLTNAPERKKRLAVDLHMPMFSDVLSGLQTTSQHVTARTPPAQPHTRPVPRSASEHVALNHMRSRSLQPLHSSSFTGSTSILTPSAPPGQQLYEVASSSDGPSPFVPTFHTPAPSYDGWPPQDPSPVYASAPGSTNLQESAFQQPPRSYSTSSSDAPRSHFSAEYMPRNTSSQSSQPPYQEALPPASVPENPPFSGTPGEYWSNYHMGNVFGNQSLVSSYAAPPRLAQTVEAANNSVPLQQPSEPVLPVNYAGLIGYFGENGPSSEYY